MNSFRFICPDCHQAFYEDLSDETMEEIRQQADEAGRPFLLQVGYLQDKMRCARCEAIWLTSH